MNPQPGRVEPDSLAAETSAALLDRARSGDRRAIDVLLARYLPRLERWATGRVPHWARQGADTQDFAQDTVVAALGRLDSFDQRHEGALQAYLRQSILNRIRTQFRRAGTRPAFEPIDDEHPHAGFSPLELAIGSETIERYESALTRLSDEQREIIVARVEMGYTNEELAALFGKPSKDAARVAVARALVRLAEEMRDGA